MGSRAGKPGMAPEDSMPMVKDQVFARGVMDWVGDGVVVSRYAGIFYGKLWFYRGFIGIYKFV